MSNRWFTVRIISKEEIPEQVKMHYHGFLPGRLTAKNMLKWMESNWRKKSASPTETAKEVLKETDRETAISFLAEMLEDDTTHNDEVALLLGQIDPSNKRAIAYLVELTQPNMWGENRLKYASKLGQITLGKEAAIATLIEMIQSDETSGDEVLKAVESLVEIDPGNQPGNETAIITLVELILDGEDKDTIVADSLERILQGNEFPKVVAALKHYMTDQVFKDNICFYTACHDVIWRCAENMSYPDFYRAWQGEPSSVQHSENPIADIASQLQPTHKTYPLVINAQALEGEIDTSLISQEICNQIYLTAFPDNQEIPEVNNAPQVKRLITKIKTQLQKPNLALIIDNCQPNQELLAFCRKITDVLHIAWITDKPLEAPLKGFPPDQSNLISAIQSWINEID